MWHVGITVGVGLAANRVAVWAGTHTKQLAVGIKLVTPQIEAWAVWVGAAIIIHAFFAAVGCAGWLWLCFNRQHGSYANHKECKRQSGRK